MTEGTAADFTLTLSSAAPTGGLDVGVTVTEASGSDFVAAGDEGSKTVSFAAGDTEASHSVPTDDDANDEPNGSITVTVSAGNGYTLGGGTPSAQVQVNDNDEAPPPPSAPTVSLSATPNPVTEGASVTVTATLSAALGNSVTIPLRLTSGTAESGDYGSLASITIAASSRSGTGTITTAQDTDTDDETFTVALGTLPSSVTAGSPSSVTVTIDDDDGGSPPSAPTVSLSATPNPVTEGASVTVTATLSAALGNSVTIPLRLTSGTAESGDYGSLASITIAASSRSGTGTITTAQDTDTDDETFTVALGTLPSSVTAGSPSSVAVTIRDDDGGSPPSAPTVRLSATPNPVTEGASVTVTATLSEALESRVTIPLTLTGGTAESGDYGSLASITIAANSRSGTGTITTAQDTDTDDETFTVALGTLPSSVTAGSPSSVAVTIRDDDGGSPTSAPTVRLSATPNPVTEGASVTVTATLSRALGNSVTIPLRLTSGTAESGDYGSLASITIAAGSRSGTGTITTAKDTDTDDGMFTVALGTLPSSVTAGSPSSVAVTIRDDDVERVPYFLSGSALYGQGFVRVINHSGEAGEVSITAIDDAGMSYGPLTLPLGARAAVHFNSRDLEQGNPAKGIESGTGAGEGAWRLVLTSALDIEVLAYVRTADGFVTTMHDEAPRTEAGEHRVVFMNPASNRNQVSALRLVNPGAAAAEARITGVDDAGESGEDAVVLTLGAGASRTVRVQALESGEGEGLSGALGDGRGKWRLRVSTDRPIRVLSVLASPTGHLANVSTAPGRTPEARRVPYFLSGSALYGQGFVRVINHSGEAGEVSITAIDDAGTSYGPLTLPLGARAAVHFNSRDLEQGNPAKGIESGTGAGEGAWRLVLTSALDIEVLAYVRTADGFVTTMHDEVPRTEAGEHRVVFMNPASNRRQVSALRLVNPGAAPAEVRITGVDDAGESGEDAVVLTLGAGASRTVRVQALESGEGEGLSGALGDGRGKWRLQVSTDQPIRMLSVLASPTGHLANVSTAPGRP